MLEPGLLLAGGFIQVIQVVENARSVFLDIGTDPFHVDRRKRLLNKRVKQLQGLPLDSMEKPNDGFIVGFPQGVLAVLVL